ncbi:MAG: DNA-protecting protein DprA [Candidatus Omnitrophica bacterium]|nr:DNA-protecting protein DprA [Candidatus Omnitrophota bacterium]
MNVNQTKAVWILNRISGFGIQKFRHLCEEVKDPAKLFDPETLTHLEQTLDFEPEFRTQFEKIVCSGEFENELEHCEKEKIQIISPLHPSYPKNLAAIYDPPLILYVKGNLILEDEVAIAIVGSRHATSYGYRVAGRFAEELTERGVTIVSGFARGIDGEAHRGALRRKGRTIAVFGCGLDVVYPKEHASLYEEILSNQGIVMSEFPLGTIPQAFNFPQRNRIIAGLSMGVLVVEASQRSGSLITARLAMEEGREVYAIPGPIDSITSSGVNKLIQNGAKLVTSPNDILEDIAPQVTASLKSFVGASLVSVPPSDSLPRPPKDACLPARQGSVQRFFAGNDDNLQDPILNLLEKRPLSLDEIAVGLEMNPIELRSRVTQLELQGAVKRTFGGLFRRTRNGS